ncbi:hypothetical protein KQX54_016350 [Cotesia glomerata]|uniref:Cytochrome P450 n=1 Tax=Cotesia glomerata TaxID=32391 RepID=A0AAV7IIT6_COTGL|nr:hypothetical protein KQX54_016350 [Cotesia glomerata]
MGKQNKSSESEVLDKHNVKQLKNEIRDLKKTILELTKINEKLRSKMVIDDEETMETTSNSENLQLDPEVVADTQDGSWQTVLKRKNKRYKVSKNETIINKNNQTDKIKEKDNNTPTTMNQKETKNRRPFKPPPINIVGQSPRDTVTAIKNGLKTDKFNITKHSENLHSLKLENYEDFQNTKKILREVKTQFYTYTPKEDKLQTLLLKGLDKEYKPEEVLDLLKNKNFQTNALSLGDINDDNAEKDIPGLEGDNLLFQSGTFFSGFESSSTTATFTLMELAKKKEYQDRAREDIKKAIDKHRWTFEAFNDMKYLDQCIAEGVRLHPSVSTIDRYTLQDYKIPDTNIIIEKGTPIYISLYGLHGDPKFFDEPEVFNPDRFSEDQKISDAYIPFGAGPRMCVGMKVGQLHVKVVLSMILSEYEVHQNPEEIYKLDSRSTFTAAANGINIEFRKLIK